jgi:hypothetical protein
MEHHVEHFLPTHRINELIGWLILLGSSTVLSYP